MLLRNSELQKQIEDDKQKKDKKKRIQEIRKSVLDALEHSSTLKEFEKKSKSQLQELEKLDIVQRHKLDEKIKKWMRNNKKEWFINYESFPDPNPNRINKNNLGSILINKIFYSEYEKPKFNIPIEDRLKYFINGKSIFRYLEATVLTKEYIEELKLHLKNRPNLFNDFSAVSFSLINHYEKKIENGKEERNKLIEDRIELYELLIKKNKRLSKLTKDETEKENLKKEYINMRNEIEDLQDILKRKITASQKYTGDDFEQYIKCYVGYGFSWKVAFAELQKISTNPHIKKATSYNSFDTTFKAQHPEYKKQKSVNPPL